jgi:heme-degrading monooxygenase HmoA
MPFGRCVIYSFAGDAEEVIEKARAGILPIFKRQSGFLAYGVMVEGDQIISMSAWDSESDAKAADEAAKQWV